MTRTTGSESSALWNLITKNWRLYVLTLVAITATATIVVLTTGFPAVVTIFIGLLLAGMVGGVHYLWTEHGYSYLFIQSRDRRKNRILDNTWILVLLLPVLWVIAVMIFTIASDTVNWVGGALIGAGAFFVTGIPVLMIRQHDIPQGSKKKTRIMARQESAIVPASASSQIRLRRNKRRQREAVLSSFSRRKLRKKTPGIDLDTFIAEWRLPKTEYFVNLDHGKKHNRLIYGPLFFAIFGFGIFVLSGLAGQWISGPVVTGFRIVAGLVFVVSLLLLEMRWESVHFKRTILLEYHIVFIDSPPMFPGGGVLPYELRQIDKVNSKTIRPTRDDDESGDSLRAKLLGSIADRLNLSWISSDTQMQHDEPLPWFGPYADGAIKAAMLDRQKDIAKRMWTMKMQEAEEDVKDRRRQKPR